jgi:hypothetical protein
MRCSLFSRFHLRPNQIADLTLTCAASPPLTARSFPPSLGCFGVARFTRQSGADTVVSSGHAPPSAQGEVIRPASVFTTGSCAPGLPAPPGAPRGAHRPDLGRSRRLHKFHRPSSSKCCRQDRNKQGRRKNSSRFHSSNRNNKCYCRYYYSNFALKNSIRCRTPSRHYCTSCRCCRTPPRRPLLPYSALGVASHDATWPSFARTCRRSYPYRSLRSEGINW